MVKRRAGSPGPIRRDTPPSSDARTRATRCSASTAGAAFACATAGPTTSRPSCRTWVSVQKVERWTGSTPTGTMNPAIAAGRLLRSRRPTDGGETAMAEKKTAAEAAPKKKRCFMITPIGEAGSNIRQHADWVFNFVLAPVMQERGYEIARADKMHDPLMITDSIFDALTKSEVCVADLTMLNANVFYELGIRHALELPVIHIAQTGTALPFDNAGYRTIMFDRQCYDSMMRLKADINAQMDTIEKPDFNLSNPLTQFRGREKLASSSDTRDQVIVDMQKQIASMARRLASAEANFNASASVRSINAWADMAMERSRREGLVELDSLRAAKMSAAEAAGLIDRHRSSYSDAIEAEQRNALNAWTRGVEKGPIPTG